MTLIKTICVCNNIVLCFNHFFFVPETQDSGGSDAPCLSIKIYSYNNTVIMMKTQYLTSGLILSTCEYEYKEK